MSGAQVLVVEGADGTGKSTLIQQLAMEAMQAGRPAVIIHNTASDADLPIDLHAYYRTQLETAVHNRAAGVTTYIDRSFLSEVIYGNLYRGHARVSLEEAQALEEFAFQNEIVLVGLVVPEETREHRVEKRGEHWDEQQPFVGAMYTKYFQSRSRFWIIADSVSAFTAH